MRQLFADDGYFIAFLVRNDAWHSQAVAFARRSPNIVTTPWVLAEVLAYMGDPPRRQIAGDFVAVLLKDPSTTIVSDAAFFDHGLALYRSRPDKAWSLVDCISFEVMWRRGIGDALLANHHFEPAGFRTLLRN